MNKPLLLGISSLFLACAGSQNSIPTAKAPKESYSYTDKQVKAERYLSTINVPFDVTTTAIERQLNAQLQGVIYEDNSYDNDNQDNFMCRVTKLRNITAATRNDTLQFSVPLKIWISVRFGLLGVYQTKDTEFSINLHLNTRFNIAPDWTARSSTNLAGFEYISKPLLKLGPVQLPITSIVNKVLNAKKELIEKGIDDAVRQNIDLKKYVLEAWNVTLQPMLLSEKYRTYLKVTPTEVQMTPIKSIGNRLRASIGIKAFTETVTGERPEARQVSSIPNLQQVQQVANDCQIGIISELSHTEATRLLSDTLVGQQFSFKEGKYNVEVTSIDLYGTENNLVIKAGLKGSINGYIYFKGVPKYNLSNRTVYLDNFDYDLDTRSVLLKAANWLLQSKFAKQMQEGLTIPIGSQVDEIRNVLQANLNHNEVTKGIFLNGRVEQFSPDKVYLTPKSIIAVVLAKGRVSLQVDGI